MALHLKVLAVWLMALSALCILAAKEDSDFTCGLRERSEHVQIASTHLKLLASQSNNTIYAFLPALVGSFDAMLERVREEPSASDAINELLSIGEMVQGSGTVMQSKPQNSAIRTALQAYAEAVAKVCSFVRTSAASNTITAAERVTEPFGGHNTIYIASIIATGFSCLYLAYAAFPALGVRPLWQQTAFATTIVVAMAAVWADHRATSNSQQEKPTARVWLFLLVGFGTVLISLMRSLYLRFHNVNLHPYFSRWRQAVARIFAMRGSTCRAFLVLLVVVAVTGCATGIVASFWRLQQQLLQQQEILRLQGTVLNQVVQRASHLEAEAHAAGSIRVFHGSVLPDGWQLCDGTLGTPDLRGRFPVGAGNGYVSGATGGQEEVTLTLAQMPAHNHGNDGFNQLSRVAIDKSTTTAVDGENGHEPDLLRTRPIRTEGGNQPHENRPPYYAVMFACRPVAA